jgi:2-oxoglutarate ferredoxin oxidoreductase subunit beta
MALEHKGFSVVEIISQRPTLYGRVNKMGGPVEMVRWLRDNALPIEKMRQQWSGEADSLKEQFPGKFLTGAFVKGAMNRAHTRYMLAASWATT